MARRKITRGGDDDDLELKELERMEEEERNAKAAALPNNTLLPLIPTSDWRDPSKYTQRVRNRPISHNRLFTTGTMTGKQSNRTANAVKGRKVPGLNGVGRESLDGLKLARKKKTSRKRKT